MSKVVLVNSDTLRKMAEYVASTKPLLKQAEQVETERTAVFDKIAKAMVDAGLLEPTLQHTKAASLADAGELDTAIEKLAKAATAHKPVGAPAGEKKAEVKNAAQTFADRIMS